MSEPVTQAQFFEGLRQVLDKIDLKHASLRDSMDEHFLRIESAMDSHKQDDAVVEKRVTSLENHREHSEGAAAKHATIVAALIAPSCIAAWEFVKHGLGWK